MLQSSSWSCYIAARWAETVSAYAWPTIIYLSLYMKPAYNIGQYASVVHASRCYNVSITRDTHGHTCDTHSHRRDTHNHTCDTHGHTCDTVARVARTITRVTRLHARSNMTRTCHTCICYSNNSVHARLPRR